ncbi:ribokinase [Skermanella aerolata]|uniref:carbohydrate kinase family protein n=1 Tax=Skermanella aerolata TaxID=393310 RepID=UPI003D218166
MVRVFTAGGIIIDNVVAADGRVGRDAMGGNAVYSAAGARLWLDEVGVVGRIPANYPLELLRRLSAHGIDISGIVTVDEEVREAEWFLYRADGSRADHLHAPIDAPGLPLHGDRLSAKECRTLEAHLRAMPATWSDFASFRRRSPVRIEDVPVRWSSARGVHLAANQPASQRAMAEALFARGLFVTADPGPNAQAIAEGGLSSFLAAVTAFLPSEKELAVLAPGLDPASGLASLRRQGAGTVVVKLGADGAMVASGAGHTDAVAVPAFPTAAVDPTGAGDAFCGGFLAGLVLTGDPRAAACLGTVSASFAVEDFGPFHLLGTTRGSAAERLSLLLGTLGSDLRSHLLPILNRIIII